MNDNTMILLNGLITVNQTTLIDIVDISIGFFIGIIIGKISLFIFKRLNRWRCNFKKGGE